MCASYIWIYSESPNTEYKTKNQIMSETTSKKPVLIMTKHHKKFCQQTIITVWQWEQETPDKVECNKLHGTLFL